MVSHGNSFIVFGGDSTDSSKTSVIAKYDPAWNKWSKLGDLNNGRYGHGVIRLGDEFLVVGGAEFLDYEKNTEACRLERDKMICSEREPTLSDF